MTTAFKTRSLRRKLTAQPWFPGALGLWFAALFGLSSLVVAPEVLERAVSAIGLDRVFPAAAPPLGETARLLIAIAASAVGEIVGLLFARALRGAKAKPSEAASQRGALEEVEGSWPPPERRAEERRFDAPRRPLFASEDLLFPEDQLEPAVEPEEHLEPIAVVRAETAPAPEPVASTNPAAEVAPLSPLARAPLDDLGPPQLTERLAMAITARKERGEGLPPGLGNRLGALAGLHGARLGTDTERAEDEDDEEDQEQDVSAESGYSSLLNIGPHRAAMAAEDPDGEEDESGYLPMRGEEDEADRAHRPALHSPQRYSGTH